MVSPKYSYLIGVFFPKKLNLTIIVHLQSVKWYSFFYWRKKFKVNIKDLL